MHTASKDVINELIWGDFETEITDMKSPIHGGEELAKPYAMNGAYALFNGFLTFVMFKLGYKPRLSEYFKMDLKKSSWWAQNLDEAKFMGLDFRYKKEGYIPPFAFKRFVNGIGRDVVVCILLDWFSFYECVLALKKSKLGKDAKYTGRIRDEFHIISGENFDVILNYMKKLKDRDFAGMHKLVLRPEGLVEHMIKQSEMNGDLDNFPKDVVTNEQWDKWSPSQRGPITIKTESKTCTEGNFKQLLDDASISVPNVVFEGFCQFLQDKAIPANEWTEIRDGYMDALKEKIRGQHIQKNYEVAMDLLNNAVGSLEGRHYVETVVLSANAVEYALGKVPDKEINLDEKISQIKKSKDLREHAEKLNYIIRVRNDIVHSNSYDVDRDTAEQILEMADQFMLDIQEREWVGPV